MIGQFVRKSSQIRILCRKIPRWWLCEDYLKEKVSEKAIKLFLLVKEEWKIVGKSFEVSRHRIWICVQFGYGLFEFWSESFVFFCGIIDSVSTVSRFLTYFVWNFLGFNILLLSYPNISLVVNIFIQNLWWKSFSKFWQFIYLLK